MGETGKPKYFRIWLSLFILTACTAASIWVIWYFVLAVPERESVPSQQALGSDALWSPNAARSMTTLSGPATDSRRPLASRVINGQSGIQDAIEQAAAQPANPRAQYLAAAAASEVGDREASRKYLEQALDIDPRHVPALLELARIEFDQGNYAQASETYSRILKIQPTQSAAAYRAFLCALLLGKSPSLDERGLPAGSAMGLYARAAAAWHRKDREAARSFVHSARAKSSPKTAIYEADLRLLGFYE